MNRDQVKGRAKEVAGKVQKEAGKLVDSPKHIIKGAAKEAVGKVQKTLGDARERNERDR